MLTTFKYDFVFKFKWLKPQKEARFIIYTTLLFRINHRHFRNSNRFYSFSSRSDGTKSIFAFSLHEIHRYPFNLTSIRSFHILKHDFIRFAIYFCLCFAPYENMHVLVHAAQIIHRRSSITLQLQKDPFIDILFINISHILLIFTVMVLKLNKNRLVSTITM